MIPDCTLVTACFDLSRYNNQSRSADLSIKNMRSLLETPCYLVIFTDSILHPHITSLRTSLGLEHLTKYNVMNVEDLDSFQYRDTVRKNREAYHPTHDARTCVESHLVCCSKFELVMKIIETNPFDTTKFGWIDSNVGENFSKICTDYKNNMLLRVLDRCSSDKFHLQILNVCKKELANDENLREYYNQYRWVVCGCLFITGKEVGLDVLKALHSEFVRHTLAGYGHGEEMFYLRVLDTHYDKLKRSYGDYSHILNNFNDIHTGLSYILHIANSYLEHRYHRECIDCCSNVLKQYETYAIPIEYPVYFKFLFNKYIALYYHYGVEEAGLYAKRLLKRIQETPHLETCYRSNKEFYDQQFAYALR
jgi:hypothetical protein